MGCLSLPCACWLFVGVLRSELTSPRSFSRPSGALMRSLSLQTQRLSDVPTFSFSLRVRMVIVEVCMALCTSVSWRHLKTQLISHREMALGRPQKRITLSLMEARASWSSALTVVKQGLFFRPVIYSI